MQNLEFSKKQLEFIKNATHRWNGKIGATQCGKTYIDIAYVIPNRIMERSGLDGLNLITGVSKGTIERNILEPMRDYWGDALVGDISSENIVYLFGEKVYCLGMEKISQVAKFRGAKFKYAYCDELVDCNSEVFELLKSRLSLSYSVCDFTGNPASPTHPLKQFIDRTDLDIYCQTWTIFDNPFLSKKFVDELCKEYFGTVYYDRYILGKWIKGEGLIYRVFADNPKKFIIDNVPDDLHIVMIEGGIDFGGNKSKHAFVLVGFTPFYREVIYLEEKVIDKEITPTELATEWVNFAQECFRKYGRAFDVNYDNAEPVLARGLEAASIQHFCRVELKPAFKISIVSRIRLFVSLLGSDRLKIKSNCTNLIQSLQEAVWNSKSQVDERLDNGTYCVDILDAAEYAIEKHQNELLYSNSAKNV